MDVTVYPGVIRGELPAIASKSHAHRLLIAAALSAGETHIACATDSEDLRATRRCLTALGARIVRTDAGFAVSGGQAADGSTADVGESGSTYRFLLPVASALGVQTRFVLGGRLPERPMQPLIDALAAHGVHIARAGGAATVSGRLTGGAYTLPGDVSSQFVSGLALAFPLTGADCELTIDGRLESRGYVDMTLGTMSEFGVQSQFDGTRLRVPGGQKYVSPGDAQTEGDWSCGAVWLTGAAASGGEARVTGLRENALQGDCAVADILQKFGARVAFEGDACRVTGGNLRGAVIDIADIPDLAPSLALLGAAAEGETALTNAGRLRYKESDRLTAIADTLNALGGYARAQGDSLIIRGRRLRGGIVDSMGDHRIAMMAACAAAISRTPVTILRAQSVNKSYPDFFRDLEKMGLTAKEADA